jgi:hypothetical protein
MANNGSMACLQRWRSRSLSHGQFFPRLGNNSRASIVITPLPETISIVASFAGLWGFSLSLQSRSPLQHSLLPFQTEVTCHLAPQLHQKPSLPMQQHHATPMPQVPSDLNPGPCPSYRHIPPLAPLGRRAGRSTWPWEFPNHEIERQHSTFTLSAGWETTTGRPPTWALLLFPVAAASLHDRPARRGLPIRQPRRRRRLSPPAHERAVSQNQSQTELEPLADSSRIRMRRQHPQTAATIQPASRESAQRVGVRRFITAEDTTGGDHPAGNSP